ncbi:hypothetical protein GM415_15980 [Pseudodesulfovibrio cashew]|uniref:Uncharacterized protein n=1 Tax=Pseudodesulfovibrio cashew TaxID=2678688 RepID=A0A6I6JFE6_9BACT|nr:hypothetical protein [Pseudodesulfovibrio cashew]QGY41555.1 hypothetical protein GM415_15980 [Pseudodesulfovibrio cashew]
MSNSTEPKVDRAAAEKAMRHISHYGGQNANWYVGIEEEGSDRDTSGNRHAARYKMASGDHAKLTMSWLLEMGLKADDEYGADPIVLFIYTKKS